jgi:sugar/nucleoside kinase (ribokinase family)
MSEGTMDGAVRALAARVGELGVLCVGQVTHDRYGDDLVAGGCACFGALCARALGARVRLLTGVGEDFLLDGALAGLEVHALRSGRTTVFTNTYPEGGHRVQRVDAVGPRIGLASLPDAWRDPDVLLLAPVFGELDAREPWSSAVDARVRAVCLQGFMKDAEPATGIVRAGEEESLRSQVTALKMRSQVTALKMRSQVTALQAGIDAIFLSEEDLACFGFPGLLDLLRASSPLVFVTRGAEGCDVYTPDGVLHAGVFPATAVDPTGAGDTFAAATACGLACGLEPLAAARLGAAAASIVVGFEGSRDMAAVADAWLLL